MSTDNRQAYVMLTKANNDTYEKGDICVIGRTVVTVEKTPNRTVEQFDIAFRPIPRTIQLEGQTIEQRVTALEKRLNAHLNTQPTEQPRETCKWAYQMDCGSHIVENPHNKTIHSKSLTTYCPTCGLRIEVVE